MTTKIDSLGSATISALNAVKGAAEKPASDAAENTAAASPASVDTLSLTGNALHLQQLEKASGGAPGVDGKRVATVRAAIAEGRYSVDAKSVASKLARFEWDLGG